MRNPETGEDLADELARDAAPAWTTAPPKVPGWYWARDADGEVSAVSVEQWHDDDGRLRTYRASSESPWDLSSFTHWMGPLPMPSDPTTPSRSGPPEPPTDSTPAS